MLSLVNKMKKDRQMSAGRVVYLTLLATLVSLFCQSVVAQELLWSTSFGDRNNEQGASCRRTVDGGYLVIGSTFSYGAGDYDIYLLKLDYLGDTLWSRTFGGPEADHGYDISVTPDNGLLLVGTTTSFGAGNRDAYVIKTDSAGNELWSRTFGGSLSDEARSIANHPDSARGRRTDRRPPTCRPVGPGRSRGRAPAPLATRGRHRH